MTAAHPLGTPPNRTDGPADAPPTVGRTRRKTRSALQGRVSDTSSAPPHGPSARPLAPDATPFAIDMPDTAVDPAQPAFVPARQFFAVPLMVADHNDARSIASGGHAMPGVVVTPATVRHGSDGVGGPGSPHPAATGQNRLNRVARTDERPRGVVGDEHPAAVDRREPLPVATSSGRRLSACGCCRLGEMRAISFAGGNPAGRTDGSREEASAGLKGFSSTAPHSLSHRPHGMRQPIKSRRRDQCFPSQPPLPSEFGGSRA